MKNAGEPSGPIAREGRNCQIIRESDRSAFLIDAKAYFEALARVLPHARQRIVIIGWDLDPKIALTPEEADPPVLGPFLRDLVERNDTLELKILVWALGPVYARKTLDLFREHTWADHPRIALAFDRRHSLRASQHQKIVCVDGTLAFVGGMDLTSERWDDRLHRAEWDLRRSPSGSTYGPVHDAQALISGAAAQGICDVAADRWRRATGEALPPVRGAQAGWPDFIAPALEDCPVAVARTVPPGFGRRRRHETAKLTDDAILAARSSLYIETQYLASFRVAGRLEASLRRDKGPEILIVVTRSSRGMLERIVMEYNRKRLMRRLRRADIHGRLRVMCASTQASDGSRDEVLIHSKIIIVDSSFARIGSSNLNNRSEGLDTECDLAFEAARADHRPAIENLRNDLLAEHLDTSMEAVAQVIDETGSMFAAVDRFAGGRRDLRDLDQPSLEGKVTPLPGTGLFDPRGPARPWQRLRSWLRRAGRALAGKAADPSARSSPEQRRQPERGQAEGQGNEEIHDAKGNHCRQ